MALDVVLHVAAFNSAVRGGHWGRFSERFAPDATLAFVGVPAGPFDGRDAIRAAYEASPPDDTLSIAGAVRVDGDDLIVPYRWDTTGGTGTMRFTESADGLVQRLIVTFG